MNPRAAYLRHENGSAWLSEQQTPRLKLTNSKLSEGSLSSAQVFSDREQYGKYFFSCGQVVCLNEGTVGGYYP